MFSSRPVGVVTAPPSVACGRTMFCISVLEIYGLRPARIEKLRFIFELLLLGVPAPTRSEAYELL